jgi:hypothetical protein
MALRPRTLAAVFAVFFLIIGVASWQWAQGPGSDWRYDAGLTRWIYMTYMIVAAVFLVGLGGLGLSIRTSFARQIREVDSHLGDMVRGSRESLPPPLAEGGTRDTVDRDIDELLESLSEVEASAKREAQRMDSGDSPMGGSADYDDGGGLTSRRERLVQRRRFLGRFLIGPAVVAGIILGISGAMLPGADNFAQSAFRLNTTLILGIGYSWIGVGWYIATTVYGLVGGGREDRRR